MGKSSKFLSKKAQLKIVEAIRIAEKNTSGEIRVHVDNDLETYSSQLTLELFHKLEMEKTKDRNAVLFHVLIKAKSLAIFGDEGIHKHVSQAYWDNLRDEMIELFKNGKYKKALVNAILTTGEKLKTYFPYQEDDKNELNDEISFS